MLYTCCYVNNTDLYYLLKECEGAYTTVISHCTVNSVGRIIGSKDLKILEKSGYLSSKK